MRYVEQIKSVVLLLLVFLSIFLTFTVWTYKPPFKVVETPEITAQQQIAEKRTLEEVVKPLKVLFHFDEVTTGTIDAEEISFIRSAMREWVIRDVTLLSEAIPEGQLTDLLSSENSTVLQYAAPVPLPVFDAYMQFDLDSSVPEAAFDRIVIDWDSLAEGNPPLYFIDTASRRVYTAAIGTAELQSFQDRAVAVAADYPVYALAEGIGKWPVYVPTEPISLPVYSFFSEEMYAQFESVLTEIDEESGDGLTGFTSVNEEMKSFSYIQPETVTSDPAIMSDLVFNTLDFLNEHGGWTDDYRYFAIDPLNQYIRYQMFVGGLPVFSDELSTRIEQWWGNTGIYNYYRPYFELDVPVTAEMTEVRLMAGTEAVELLTEVEGLERDEVLNLLPAYQLEVNSDERLLELTPAWYYQTGSSWFPLIQEEQEGGVQLGLE
ncbi:YycH family regulatory protein [Indiicoccus explosivorum]|uniref:YycH family regulatory protein n=1 Tax=Indiicoccus explosivorum TaxID=1917864 RepID=UPI00138FC080|nr:two-component system activity regulator YycH [Indiicoccus explosivorum]